MMLCGVRPGSMVDCPVQVFCVLNSSRFAFFVILVNYCYFVINNIMVN